jgi:hypothetical protein
LQNLFLHLLFQLGFRQLFVSLILVKYFRIDFLFSVFTAVKVLVACFCRVWRNYSAFYGQFPGRTPECRRR